MNILDMAAILPGERMLAKYTGGGESPSNDEIADLAYQFYERHGRRDGHDQDDWLAAEQELKHHYQWLSPGDGFITRDPEQKVDQQKGHPS